MSDSKTLKNPRVLSPEEKALLKRLEKRFERHRSDKLMTWLKQTTGKHLMEKLRGGVSP